MSSIDFALKDFFRKKRSNYPFLLMITLVVAFTEFLIYFTTAIGLNIFIPTDFINKNFFSGGIYVVYQKFNAIIQVLLIILSVALIVVVTTTLVLSKKRDIAIMRALGTLPRKLYGFYLTEAFILFIIGFFLGLVSGFIAYGVFVLVMEFFNFPIVFYIDLIYTPIMFISSLIGIFVITGYTIRKIGGKSIIKTFSKDIPFNYDASQKLKFILKWLASLGFNLRIAIINTIRKKGEFIRYLIIFTIMALLIFTLGLGTIVLSTSSHGWIQKSQNENIVVIGHKDVINNYSLMYQMFSDPNLLISENNINFTDPQYLFNGSVINEIKDLNGVELVEERLINFYSVEEIQGIYITEDDTYKVVGKDRQDNIPIIGINPETIIQDFEIEGRFFTEEDAFENITIGDGLAYNLFDYALAQSLKISATSKTFHISGVVIDSFYNGYVGYISINESRKLLNLMHNEINIVLIKLHPNTYYGIQQGLDNITKNLGSDFSYLKLDNVFKMNLNFLSYLSLYPIFLIIVISGLAILSLFNYQKVGIIEKSKDFLIMRAIGSKISSIRKILFTESVFIILPSLLLSFGIGMILSTNLLLSRAYLPPLIVPLIFFIIILGIFMIFNFLSLIPIVKKINYFNIKDFNI
ncbi:MAG TPA: ABC transporter permease [archaeon]|nr:ABC transporter permease [archaeon]